MSIEGRGYRAVCLRTRIGTAQAVFPLGAVLVGPRGWPGSRPSPPACLPQAGLHPHGGLRRLAIDQRHSQSSVQNFLTSISSNDSIHGLRVILAQAPISVLSSPRTARRQSNYLRGPRFPQGSQSLSASPPLPPSQKISSFTTLILLQTKLFSSSPAAPPGIMRVVALMLPRRNANPFLSRTPHRSPCRASQDQTNPPVLSFQRHTSKFPRKYFTSWTATLIKQKRSQPPLSLAAPFRPAAPAPASHGGPARAIIVLPSNPTRSHPS